MFEMAGIPEAEMRKALKQAGDKVNVLTKIVLKGEIAHE